MSNTIKLNNGLLIPNVGIGTFTLTPDQAHDSVKFALENGYKLVDTANSYVNEKGVGRGIKDSKVNRKDIFVSSKLWIKEYTNPNAVKETLERLQLEYLDILFLHQAVGDYVAGYRMLEDAYEKGLIKAIGLSNFFEKPLKEIFSIAKHLPQVAQIEVHPYFHADNTRKILDLHNVKVMSWYPLGHGDKNLLQEKVFVDLAKKYNKTPAQIILRWHLEMGFIVIPGSKNPDHIKANLEIQDFKLSQEDMVAINAIHKNEKYFQKNDENDEEFLNFLKNRVVKYED